MNDARAARFRRLEPLLDRALELEGEARDRFLALCAEIYPDLVMDLRRALEPRDDLLPDIGAVAASATAAPATDRRGLIVGNWRLLERLGRGGQSTVYRAERLLPAGQYAAVKLLRSPDPAHRDLFERERTLLARLSHEGIARLLDSGGTRDSQAWLAIELADGHDLDVWLREVQPDLPRRLAVLAQVADAVAYAHSCGVLHRDLKPSNVRVDGADRSKLLDFGIGRWLDAAPGGTRLQVLTPDWAAPEQILGQPTGTATDVYALGALLYLMLTGSSPYPHFDGNWANLLETAGHRSPVPPSRAFLAQPDLAIRYARRPGDLDAITLRALSVDPQQRHRSAAEFASGIRAAAAQEA